MNQLDTRESAKGVAYGLAAYGTWGVAPLYFKAVALVPALEVLGHRVVWSVVLLIGWMAWRRRLGEAVRAVRVRATFLTLTATTVLIAANWLVFIWSVAHNYLKFASLGYFMNPLLNVLLGYLFLKERLRRLQTVSVLLAGCGAGYLVFGGPRVPAVGLGIAALLAGTFGFYGLLRKTVRTDALVGLTVETTLLAPFALGYLIYLAGTGVGTFGARSLQMDVLLAFAGLLTSVPLLWFTNAARRVSLSTLGFMQYLAPTGHFLLAVLVFGEPCAPVEWTSFGFIWAALTIYSADAVIAQRRLRTALVAGQRRGPAAP